MTISGFNQQDVIFPIDEYYAGTYWFQGLSNITDKRLSYLVYAFGLPCGPTQMTDLRDANSIYNKDNYVATFEGEHSTILRSLLLTGSYGDFPPITAPKTDTHRWIDKTRKLDEKTNLSYIIEDVCMSIGDVSPIEAVDHASMYRVVHFLTCIRHDVMAADLHLRKVPWNPIVSFTNPFYYKSGFMHNWVMSNNILKAEIVEFLFNVYHLLISTYKVRDNWFDYKFFILGCSERDVSRLQLFDYIEDRRVMVTVCYIVSRMHECLDMLESQLKLRPLDPRVEIVTRDTLLKSVQRLFKKVQGLMAYIRSFRYEKDPPTKEERFADEWNSYYEFEEEGKRKWEDFMNSFEEEKKKNQRDAARYARKKRWEEIKRKLYYFAQDLWFCFFGRR